MERPDPQPRRVTVRLSGTVSTVLSTGGKDWWRCLVATPDGSVAMVRCDRDPSLRPGDDIDVHGDLHPGDGTPGLPRCITVGARDLKAAALTAALRDPGTIAVASTVDDDSRTQSLSGLVDELNKIPGISVVGRSGRATNPDVAWVTDRFSGMTAAPGDGPILVMQPEVMLPPDSCASRLGAQLAAAASVALNALGMPARRAASIDRTGLSIFPAAMADDVINDIRWSSRHSPLAARGNPHHPSLVVPIRPLETATGLFALVARGKGPAGFVARAYPPIGFLDRIVAAHEVAHAVERGRNVDRRSGHESECFADAVAVMLMASAGARTEDLRLYADWRSISPVVPTSGRYFRSAIHSTGPACNEAILRGRALLRLHAPAQVPMDEILESAGRISRRHGMLRPEIEQLDARLRQIDPASWRSLSATALAHRIHDLAAASAPRVGATLKAAATALERGRAVLTQEDMRISPASASSAGVAEARAVRERVEGLAARGHASAAALVHNRHKRELQKRLRSAVTGMRASGSLPVSILSRVVEVGRPGRAAGALSRAASWALAMLPPTLDAAAHRMDFARATSALETLGEPPVNSSRTVHARPASDPLISMPATGNGKPGLRNPFDLSVERRIEALAAIASGAAAILRNLSVRYAMTPQEGSSDFTAITQTKPERAALNKARRSIEVLLVALKCDPDDWSQAVSILGREGAAKVAAADPDGLLPHSPDQMEFIQGATGFRQRRLLDFAAALKPLEGPRPAPGYRAARQQRTDEAPSADAAYRDGRRSPVTGVALV